MSQLRELAEPFPRALISQVSKQGHGADYVSHSTVTERLLSIVGPFHFQVREVIYGDIPEMQTQKATYPARRGVVAVLAELTCTIDGQAVTVVEAGDDENGAMHTDGQALKNAASDALKRCAMRLGLGLHLWSQGDYFLHAQLDKDTGENRPEQVEQVFGVSDTAPPPTTRENASEVPEKNRVPAFVMAGKQVVLGLADGDKDLATGLWNTALEMTGAGDPPTPLQVDRAVQYVKDNLQ